MIDQPTFDPGALATQRTIVLRFDLADPTFQIDVDLGDVPPQVAWIALCAAAEECAEHPPLPVLIHRGELLTYAPSEGGD